MLQRCAHCRGLTSVDAIGTALVASLTVALTVLSLACGVSDGVPEGLLGRWETSDPRYVDRAFIITPTTLSIQTGPDSTRTHAIISTTASGSDRGVVLRIGYLEAGSENLLSVGLGSSASDGSPEWIHLANQPEIEWRRHKGR